jgi:hypothetical protein
MHVHTSPLQDAELGAIPSLIPHAHDLLPVHISCTLVRLGPVQVGRVNAAEKKEDAGDDVRRGDDVEPGGLLILGLREEAEGDVLAALVDPHEVREPKRDEIVSRRNVQAERGQSVIKVLEEGSEWKNDGVLRRDHGVRWVERELRSLLVPRSRWTVRSNFGLPEEVGELKTGRVLREVAVGFGGHVPLDGRAVLDDLRFNNGIGGGELPLSDQAQSDGHSLKIVGWVEVDHWFVAPQLENEMNGRMTGYVVIVQSSFILELLAGKDKPLLVGRYAFLVLQLQFGSQHSIAWIADQTNGFPGFVKDKPAKLDRNPYSLSVWMKISHSG